MARSSMMLWRLRHFQLQRSWQICFLNPFAFWLKYPEIIMPGAVSRNCVSNSSFSPLRVGFHGRCVPHPSLASVHVYAFMCVHI